MDTGYSSWEDVSRRERIVVDVRLDEHRGPGAPQLGPLVSVEERRALATAGYSGRTGLGRAPALLVVDVTYAFCGPDPDATLGEAVRTHPHASGAPAWRAVERIRELVGLARERSWPLVFTRPGDPGDVPWAVKQQRHDDVPDRASEIVPETGYRTTDLLIDKPAPSAFFATTVADHLRAHGADTVVVCGGVTSGCVRASAVDAFSHGFATTVVEDATFDRLAVSHLVALFDLDLKYADVRSTRDLVAEVTATD